MTIKIFFLSLCLSPIESRHFQLHEYKKERRVSIESRKLHRCIYSLSLSLASKVDSSDSMYTFLLEAKNARIAEAKKKWGSRFKSDLNNATRYQSQILIWYSWIIQLSKSVEFVRIGQKMSEKFWFQVWIRERNSRGTRFSPLVTRSIDFVNQELF